MTWSKTMASGMVLRQYMQSSLLNGTQIQTILSGAGMLNAQDTSCVNGKCFWTVSAF